MMRFSLCKAWTATRWYLALYAVLGLMGLCAYSNQARSETPQEMAPALLAYASEHSGFPMPRGVAMPNVALVGQGAFAGPIRAEACGADKDCVVYGLYLPWLPTVVEIDNTLALGTNTCAKAVLVHELVHFLQFANDAFPGIPEAFRSAAREDQAYSVEQTYLDEHGAGQWRARNLPVNVLQIPDCSTVEPVAP